MKQNMGNQDRLVRAGIAILLGILLFAEILTGLPAILAGIAGLLLLGTSVAGTCPGYFPLNISTRKKDAV